MHVDVIVGMQWGDEGKGKIVDILAPQYDVVARYQGGPNAGHTVVRNGQTYVLHSIPSGVLAPGVVNVIGNGVVVDFSQLNQELETLEGYNIDTRNVYLSSRAHVIMPYHRWVEGLGAGKDIGTTNRGIGPTYTTKAQRTGIRVADFQDPDRLIKKMEKAAEYLPDDARSLLGRAGIRAVADEHLSFFGSLKDRVIELPYFFQDLKHGRDELHILCEGAQGTLLDVDHGTYPFVTSSSAVAGGACIGLGLPPKVNKVIGVTKAYATRVGRGPFPTELGKEEDAEARLSEVGAHEIEARVLEGCATDAEIGHYLRIEGRERGSTTGRARRTGWHDFVTGRHAILINGVDEIALMKLDVLDGVPELKACDWYENCSGNDRRVYMSMPSSDLDDFKASFLKFDGWKESTSGATTFDDLPVNARRYVEEMESRLGVPIKTVSVGPDHAQTIFR